MINKLVAFFNTEIAETESADLSERQQQLASAALLIEVGIADGNFDGDELASLRQTLQRKFKLDSDQLDALIQLAREEHDQATSIYQFTQLINQYCHVEDKYKLILGMWDVAYADGDLDKYEEHLIRRVADLIYVSHSDFIRAKMKAKETSEQQHN